MKLIVYVGSSWRVYEIHKPTTKEKAAKALVKEYAELGREVTAIFTIFKSKRGHEAVGTIVYGGLNA